MKRAIAVIGLMFLGAAAPLPATDVIAVLSGDQAPYQEALSGLKAALGAQVTSVVLPQKPDLSHARIVVSFGTQAALEEYPGLNLIYAMVPDQSVKPGLCKGRPVRIEMLPQPGLLAERMLLLQPGLGTACFFDINGGFKDYIHQVESALSAKGAHVSLKRVDSQATLAVALRALKGNANALWLPPSPLLLNPDTFKLTTEFCASQSIALYAPVASLVRLGAVAGIAPTFRNVGQAAGEAAQKLLAGGVLGESIYPGQSEMKLNRSAASKVGLSFSKEAINTADEVVP